MNTENSDEATSETLKRATVIMTLTAWDMYVEDVASDLIEVKYGIVIGA